MSQRTALTVAMIVSGLIGSLGAWLFMRTDTQPDVGKSALVEKCAGVDLDQEVACFSGLVLQEYAESGLDAAALLMEDAAKDMSATAGRFAARCHDVAHALGKAVDIVRESDLESRAPQVCRSGFFHGVHFQRFTAYTSPADLITEAPRACTGSEDIIQIGLGGVGNGCRHALGHELIIRGVDALVSARACMDPPQGADNVESAIADCLHGVYMEVFLTREAVEGYADPEPLCAPALELSLPAGRACYGEAGLSLFRRALDPAAPGAFEVCQTLLATNRVVADSCAGGVGRTAAAFLENDEQALRQYCGAAAALADICLVEAAAAIMEAENDLTWVEVCDTVSIEAVCREKMADIEALLRSIEGSPT